MERATAYVLLVPSDLWTANTAGIPQARQHTLGESIGAAGDGLPVPRLCAEPFFAPHTLVVLLGFLTASALTVAIITVLQLPPRLSRSTEVIMEFRYGICCLWNRRAQSVRGWK